MPSSRDTKETPNDLETMAVEFADRIRRLVLREVTRTLEDMPEAQEKIRRLELRSRRKTDFEIRTDVLETLAEAGRALTFHELERRTFVQKGRLTLALRALEARKKIATVGSHRAKRYRLSK